MKIYNGNELPKEINDLALKKVDAKYDYVRYLKTNDLNDAFNWGKTKEGFDFWNNIDDGDFSGFYKLHPKKTLFERLKKEILKQVEVLPPTLYLTLEDELHNKKNFNELFISTISVLRTCNNQAGEVRIQDLEKLEQELFN